MPVARARRRIPSRRVGRTERFIHSVGRGAKAPVPRARALLQPYLRHTHALGFVLPCLRFKRKTGKGLSEFEREQTGLPSMLLWDSKESTAVYMQGKVYPHTWC